MEERLLNDLKIDLADSSDFKDDVLMLAIQRAIRTYTNKRNFPKYFNEAEITRDLEQHYDCIYDLALFKINKRGAEFEDARTESGTSYRWKNENEIFLAHGTFPYPTFLY